MIMAVQKIRGSERHKWRRKPKLQTVPAIVVAPIALMPVLPPAPALTAADRARIAKWIRDRVTVDWRDSCWRCRKPIVVGQRWAAVAGEGVIARFHQNCHREWLAEQETLARKALGLAL
jgi:hypothetical protein